MTPLGFGDDAEALWTRRSTTFTQNRTMPKPKLDQILREALDRAQSQGISRQCRYKALSRMIEMQAVAIRHVRARLLAASQTTCRCGSGQPLTEAVGSRGEFICYCCSECRDVCLTAYRSAQLTF